jgi:hypothetical protein
MEQRMKKTAIAAVAAAALAAPLSLGATAASAAGPSSAYTTNQAGYPLTLVYSSGVTDAGDVPAGDGNGGQVTSDWNVQDPDNYTLVYQFQDPGYSSPITITFHGRRCTVTGQNPNDVQYGCAVYHDDDGRLNAYVEDRWT